MCVFVTCAQDYWLPPRVAQSGFTPAEDSQTYHGILTSLVSMRGAYGSPCIRCAQRHEGLPGSLAPQRAEVLQFHHPACAASWRTPRQSSPCRQARHLQSERWLTC